MPIPADSVQVNLGRGTATMRLARTSMPDQQDVVNALNNGPSVPGRVSFTVRWKGSGRRKRLRNAQHKFVADIVENASTIEWQAELDAFRLASDPAATSRNIYSLIGRERNGTFFR